MKKAFLGVVAIAAMAVPTSVSAHGGPPVDVFTSTTTGTDSLLFQGPCGDGPGIVTVDFHDTFHVTAFADGHVRVVANQAGTFAFEPLDPSEASSSGRYRNGSSFGETQNGLTNTSVFNVVGVDENGDQVKFQIRTNFVVSNGEVRVDNFEVGCG